MTSNDCLIGLPNGDVTRSRSIARLVPSQRWKKDAVLAIRGTPSRPLLRGDDDSIIESVGNPHLHLDAELKAKLEDEEALPTDLPECLRPDRKLPSLRVTKSDLDKYGCTEGCHRCTNTQVGDTLSTPNHWDSCRRRVYQDMFLANDPKMHKWLKDHPTDPGNVGASVGLTPSPAAASSSTSPTPTSAPVGPPAPSTPAAAGDLTVFDGADENDFKSVVTMLVAHGVQVVDAQRFVTSMVKGKPCNNDATGFFELYGRGGLSKAARKYRSLNVEGLEVLDLRTARPDGECWDFTRKEDIAWAMRLLREQQPMWVIAAPPCTAFSILNQNWIFPKMAEADVRRKVDEGSRGCLLSVALA